MTTKKTPGRPAGSSTAEEDILIGAVEAFALYGFHDCSVANILEHSGTSRTNFYRVFKNKEAVFELILKKNLSALQKVMQQAFADVNPDKSLIEQLLSINETYLDACFLAGDLLPVLFQEQFSLPSHRKLREQTFAQLLKGIQKTIANSGREVPDKLLIDALLTGVDRVVLQVSQKKISTARKKALAMDVIEQLLIAFE